MESARNTADILTKALGFEVFMLHRTGLSVRPVMRSGRAHAVHETRVSAWKLNSRENPYRGALLWEKDLPPWTKTECGHLVFSTDAY